MDSVGRETSAAESSKFKFSDPREFDVLTPSPALDLRTTFRSLKSRDWIPSQSHVSRFHVFQGKATLSIAKKMS